MAATLKTWLVNVALLVVSVTIVLAAFELFLWYDDWHPRAADYTSEVTLNGTTYHFIESASAFDQPKSAVLIAGDSFTAGSSCADHRNFPSVFTRTAARKGVDLHAVNLGMQGTGPVSYAERVEDYLQEKGTAAGVIMALYANDVEIDCEACRRLHSWSNLGGLTDADRAELEKLCEVCRQTEDRKLSGEVGTLRRFNWWLAEQLKTFLLLREVAARVAIGAGLLEVNWGRAAFPERWRDVEGLYFKQIRAAIELTRDETSRRSIPMMVVIYPDPVGLNDRSEYVPLYAQAQATLSRETGVPVYSGYEAFLGDPRTKENMAFSLTDTHPSCEAHAIFGEWVFQKWAALRDAHAPAVSRR